MARLGGIVSYFSRSTLRSDALKKYSHGLLFIKYCKTRFAYQTYFCTRLVILKPAAEKALIDLGSSAINEEDVEFHEKHTSVKNALNDDSLWKFTEIYVRVSFPVLLVMRFFDSGLPSCGFVFWAHSFLEQQVQLIINKINEHAAFDFRRCGQQIMDSIRFVWDKRHRPIHSFAYLVNPLFHQDFDEECPFDLCDSFRDDVNIVLETMIKKRFPEKSIDEVSKEKSTVLQELMGYFQRTFTCDEKENAKTLLATEWWQLYAHYRNLAFYAIRAHSAVVVSSHLERHFSGMSKVQSLERNRLNCESTSLYASARQTIRSNVNLRRDDAQQKIIKFVKSLQEVVLKEIIDEVDLKGLSDVENWLTMLSETDAGMDYSKTSTPNTILPTTSANPEQIELVNQNEQNEEGNSEETDEVIVGLDFDSTKPIRYSNRQRKPVKKLNL
jgi:hypothetical protein